MRGKEGMAGLLRVLRRRAAGGLAATTSLTMAAAMVAAPSYAATSSDTPSTEQANVSSALAAAKETGKRVKITDATTERSEYYATPDGKVTGVVSAGAVRFRRNGAWVPVDLTLQRQADGSVAPAAYPEDLRISGARTAGSGDLASMGSGDQRVTVGWQGVLPEPQLDGSTATYPDVLPGVDLVVQATAKGFEQSAVVKSAAAAKYVGEISLPMTGPGVSSVVEDKHGGLRVRDAGGQQRANIPTPMMWDARSATRGGPPKRRQVTVDVVPSTPASAAGTAAAGPVTLKLKPDQKWLTSPDTVYPVTIDPYYDWSTTVVSTTVVKGYSAGWPDADSLFVGTYDDTWSARSFVTWWATGIQGMQIDAATLHLANPYSTSCSTTPWEIWTTDPITADTSWDNQPAWQYKEATSTSTSCDGGWVTADATSFFKRAVGNGIGTPTMGLRAADETDYSQYKQFSSCNSADPSQFPYVEVNYSDLPADSTITSPTVTLLTGEIVPADPAVRTTEQEAAYRDQINQLDAQGELTPQAMDDMALRLLTPPTVDEPATQQTAAAQSSQMSAMSCSIGDSATSASAITVNTPKITFNGSSQNYMMYATGTYQWASNKPYSACTSPIAVGGVDGFAIALNRSSTNLGVSFTGCNIFGKCGGNGYLETNSQYGGGWAVQDYAGNAYNGQSPTYRGTLTYSFRLPSLSGCTQAFTKYGHDWNSTAVNGIGISPNSISLQWTSSSSSWQKSSQAGRYGSC